MLDVLPVEELDILLENAHIMEEERHGSQEEGLHLEMVGELKDPGYLCYKQKNILGVSRTSK